MTVTPNQPEPSPRPSGDVAPSSAETLSGASGTPTLTPGRLGLLLVVVMLDLLGIGILIPVLPYIVKQFTDNAMIAGVLGTAYAMCQFLATPILGSISDRVGRRPVLVLSLFGSAIGYVIFGLAGALYVLFIGRIIDGITGGNISTAYAYAADCTKPAQRARTFGLLGAAMGLGFIIGPAIGGWLSTQSLAVGSIKVDGVHLPAFAAAVATMTAAVWATLVLPESLPRERRVTRRMTLADINPLKTVSGKFTRGAFAPIVGAGMILTFTQTAMHGVFAFWTADAFGWTAPNVAKILVMAGVVGVLVQGGLVRVLSRAIGDRGW
ncbi:MAG: MFS transporter [Phycisphaerales bacterium]|nr:MFS transporter [Phycisphaerales bacterium]